MKTERELLIDTYIEDHPKAKLPNTEPVFIHGKPEPLEVFKLPIKLLVFNIGNGRFAAELLEEQKRLKRELDVTKEDDVKVIQSLLLNQNAAETHALKEDIRKNGQIYPGIITVDGAVINANRRMAIIQSLYQETGEERFEFLIVARLPKGVDAKALWRIEAKLQFGRDYRLEYGQVNELLKIRAGRNSGLTDKQISEALAGRYSPNEVGVRLEILKLMESYLHYIGKPGEFKHIQEEQSGEHFISLQKSVVGPLKVSAFKSEVPKIMEVAFSMIRGVDGKKRPSHLKIRRLRDIVELPTARTALLSAYNAKGQLKPDRAAVLDAFETADFIVEMQEEKDRPEKLAGRALSALTEIDAKHQSIKNADFQKLLADIAKEIQRLTVPHKNHGKAGH